MFADELAEFRERFHQSFTSSDLASSIEYGFMEPPDSCQDAVRVQCTRKLAEIWQLFYIFEWCIAAHMEGASPTSNRIEGADPWDAHKFVDKNYILCV